MTLNGGNPKQLLEYVSQNIPYYKGLNSSSIEDFPIITKHQIRQNYEKFISDKYDRKDFIVDILNGEKIKTHGWYNETQVFENIVVEETSGTSGIPFLCFKTKKERAQLALSLWKARRQNNRNISPSNLFLFSHTGMNKENPRAYDYNIEHLIDLYNQIIKGGFVGIHGTPTAFINHINSLKKQNVKLDFSKIKYIECTGSYLSTEAQNEIEEFYDANVINEYGTIETWPIGFGIKNNEIIVNTESIYLELIDDFGNVIKDIGKKGMVVVTTLMCKTMPFVRYSLGDYAEYISIGQQNKVIKLLEGREINIVKGFSPKVYGNQFFLNAIKTVCLNEKFNISYVKIIQSKMDCFIIEINFIDNSERFMQKFNSFIRKNLRKDIKIKYKFLMDEEIECRKYEKPNIFICKC